MKGHPFYNESKIHHYGSTQKFGSENEGMPREGCWQNQSAVSGTPVPLGYFQPSNLHPFCKLSFDCRSARRLEMTLLQPSVLPAGHKLADLFTRGLGARNLLLVKSF